jgi:AAA family ATP:ADP antiporter
MIHLLKQLTKDQKKFIILVLGFSFLITMDYSCLRPAMQSLFVTHFGSKWLPWVWLASLPINFLTVACFNKAQNRFGSQRLSLCFPWLVLGLNLTLGLLSGAYKSALLIFFIWKDLYILLMFQQLWSQIGASLGHTVGRKLYGAMYAMGALGSMAGSSFPAIFKLPASSFLFCTLLIYPFIFVLQKALFKSPLSSPFESNQKKATLEGLKQIKASPELVTIGLLVALMQMVSALSEFSFSYHLEKNFSDLASRTQASAYTMSLMHGLTLALQLLVAILTLDKLGIKRGHKLIPMTLSGVSLAYIALPSFATASIGYVSCKALDFSLFSVLKESLYAPLDKAYKYQAKSFIDIFVYRGAKTLTSLLLILLSSFHSSLSLGLLLLFVALIWTIVAKKRLDVFSASLEA